MEPAPLGADEARTATRRAVWSILLLLGAILLVTVALSQTELGAATVADLRARAHPLGLLGAFGLISLAFVCMAMRWRSLLLAARGAPVLSVSAILCAGLLLNYALPGPVGEVAAAWFLARRQNIPVADALAAGITGRVIGLCTAAVAALGVWLLTDLPVPPALDEAVTLAALITGGGGLGLALFAARPAPFLAVAAVVLRPVRRLPRAARLADGLERGLGAVATAFGQTAQAGWGAWLRAIGWSVAGHSCVVAGICAGAASVDAAAHLGGAIFAYAASTAAVVVLFAIPGSQVAWDGLFTGLLVATAGLALPDALVVGLLVRVQQLFFMLLGGVTVFVLLRPPGTGTSRLSP